VIDMNAEEPKPLNSNKREDDLPVLSESGQRALELLKKPRDFEKLKYPGQVVYIDPPELRFNGNICSVIRDDYFAPESCSGDYNKTLYDGCDFPISILYDALSRITPGGKVTLPGRGIFRMEDHEWGFEWEEIYNETLEEDDITIVLELSSSACEVSLLVQRGMGIYEKIERKTQPPSIFQRLFKTR
jgi:hypothetical protein